MKNQAEVENVKTQCSSGLSTFGFLIAGLGIGAVASVLLAPKSGPDARKWIATKCLDGVEAANTKVHEARMRAHEILDQGQQKVGAAVAARRQVIAEPKAEAKTGAV